MSLHLRLQPTCVGPESKNKGFEPGDPGAAIGMESALAIGARRLRDQQGNPVLVLNVTHHHNPSLVLPSLMGNACPDVAHQSSTLWPFASVCPSSGLLLVVCVNDGSGVPEK